MLALLRSRRVLGSRLRPRTLLPISLVTALLTMALAALAVRRIQLYDDHYGLTMLRLYSASFAVWLIVIVAVICVALVRPGGHWVVPTVGLLALVCLFTMNAINPEAIVARYNTSHPLTAEPSRRDNPRGLDTDYLGDLSPDAIPTLFAQLAKLEPTVGTALRTSLCHRSIPRPSFGFLGWSTSVLNARAAQRSACSTPT
jgi:Domain of unknown function (DUF4173)